MFVMNVQVEFRFETSLDFDKLFETVADAIFDIESESEALFNADASMTGSQNLIWLGLVAKGPTADAAVDEAIRGIRLAIAKSGGSAQDWGVPSLTGDSNATYRFISEEITTTELIESVKTTILA